MYKQRKGEKLPLSAMFKIVQENTQKWGFGAFESTQMGIKFGTCKMQRLNQALNTFFFNSALIIPIAEVIYKQNRTLKLLSSYFCSKTGTNFKLN